jgi:hypothetical protein
MTATGTCGYGFPELALAGRQKAAAGGIHAVPAGHCFRCLADVSVRNHIARERGKLENVWVNTRRFVSWILLVSAIGGGLAACSGGSSTTSSAPASAPSSPAAAAPSASGSSSSAEQAITTNWEAFFNAQTPVAKRVSLLQDGQAMSSVISAQAGSGLASQATAKVTKVTVTSPTQAKVTYTILVAGTPALKNQSGVAVNQDGTWKVGLASFCGLLALENSGDTSGLPAACSSAAA